MTDQYSDKYLVVVAGPTAIGKTEVAIQLARFLKTEIVSADARQIFKGMAIGTAKPSGAELGRTRHHMISKLELDQSYSVSDYEKDALLCITKVHQKQHVCILSGGSGLYMQAVLEGFDSIPTVPEELRDQIHRLWKDNGIKWLQNAVAEADPDYFRVVDAQNPRRLIRALSVIQQTGQRYSSFLHGSKKDRDFHIIPILLSMERSQLYERIDKRVDRMVDRGLKEEARSLLIYRHQQALATVGYQEYFQYFDGDIPEEEALRLIKRNSRRYAKRQLTWFRKFESWKRFEANQIHQMLEYIRSEMDITRKPRPSQVAGQ
ncbi:MAG: tRNA (adenosine(37)-N6)-dimethylallyltransferase MiaA [Saprospiraceae bacterium]|nr:tRNA (adenosine(37)-N6)-dimethylallyltransferase MiaA [Saprospiraceae bacterium]